MPSRDAIYAGSLLGYVKSVIKSTATGITEAATPQVRETLVRHLQQAIEIHREVFEYMLSRNLYPAYHVEQTVQNDYKNADAALSMPIRNPHS